MRIGFIGWGNMGGRRHATCNAGSQLWVHERFREAAERYGDGAGEMTVCKVIEDDAGVELRVEGEWLAPWEVKHPSDT